MPTFPAGITPVAWFDGTQAAFSDTAGTVAAVVGGPLGRVNEASPLTSYWSAPNQKPVRDTAGARFDYFGSPVSPSLTQPGTPAITTNNCVLAIAFLARDGGSGPAEGLLRATVTGGGFGLYAGGGTLACTYNNGAANWAPSVPGFVAGDHIVFVVKYTSTGLKAWLVKNGATYTDTLTASISGGAMATPFVIGDQNGANQGIYGFVSQALAAASAPSDADALALSVWLDAQTVPVAFPTTAPLIAVCGDSIARNVPGAPIYQAWCWTALQNARASYPGTEMYNGAVGGAGAVGVTNTALPYYSASRSRNVMVIAIGTNDLATGSSPSATLATILAQYDAALAAGWRPLIATILDRSAALTVSQATFDAGRALINNGILSSGRNVIDLTGVAGLSASGASAGANFVGDGVHPGAGGHALMAAVYTPAIMAQLGSVPLAPSGLTLSLASTTSVNVAWTDNATDETGYRVYYSTTGIKPGTPQATLAANATSTTIAGLSIGSTYTFWVEAYNANGSSASITGSILVPTTSAASKTQMQAKSSTNQQLYTWLADSPDYAGTGYTGPGTPLDVVIYATKRAVN